MALAVPDRGGHRVRPPQIGTSSATLRQNYAVARPSRSLGRPVGSRRAFRELPNGALQRTSSSATLSNSPLNALCVGQTKRSTGHAFAGQGGGGPERSTFELEAKAAPGSRGPGGPPEQRRSEGGPWCPLAAN